MSKRKSRLTLQLNLILPWFKLPSKGSVLLMKLRTGVVKTDVIKIPNVKVTGSAVALDGVLEDLVVVLRLGEWLQVDLSLDITDIMINVGDMSIKLR